MMPLIHPYVPAVERVNTRPHAFRHEALEIWMYGVIVICENIPARLRLPCDAWRVLVEELRGRWVVCRPNDPLLFGRKIAREGRRPGLL